MNDVAKMGDRALVLPSPRTPPEYRHMHGNVVTVISDPCMTSVGIVMNQVENDYDKPDDTFGLFHETHLLLPLRDPDAGGWVEKFAELKKRCEGVAP